MAQMLNGDGPPVHGGGQQITGVGGKQGGGKESGGGGSGAEREEIEGEDSQDAQD